MPSRRDVDGLAVHTLHYIYKVQSYDGDFVFRIKDDYVNLKLTLFYRCIGRHCLFLCTLIMLFC